MRRIKINTPIATTEPIKKTSSSCAPTITTGKAPTVIFDPSCHAIKLLPCFTQPALGPVNICIQILEQSMVHIQLLVNLQRNMMLPINRMRQVIQVLVLFYHGYSCQTTVKQHKAGKQTHLA
jgi:hypothetical protein